ncbi:MAG: endonuclease domain-containing protein [Reyranellales bacterium]|jgi:very-short-patch-repair endonuclease
MLRHTRALRHDQTSPERLLWSRLRRRQVARFKFRRQHQIGLYICDFASLDGRLIIELDGSQHLERTEYDDRRDSFLRSAGYRVLRFWNGDVQTELDAVVDTIFAALHQPEIDGRI